MKQNMVRNLPESASSQRRGPVWYRINSLQNFVSREHSPHSSHSGRKTMMQSSLQKKKILFLITITSLPQNPVFFDINTKQQDLVRKALQQNVTLCIKQNALTAATGTSISTKSPANECLMSLSFTSRKYCAHSC